MKGNTLVFAAAGEDLPAHTVADDHGVFQIDGLLPGTYRVNALTVGSGRKTDPVSVEVSGGEIATVELPD